MRTGVSTSLSRSSLATASPKPPTRPLSSTVADQPVLPRGLHESRVQRLHPARVDDRDADAVISQPVGRLSAHGGHRARAQQQDVAPGGIGRNPEHVHRAELGHCRHIRGRLPSGEAQRGRPVADRNGFPQQFSDPGAIAGHGNPQSRHELQDGAVPHAVVASAVRAGYARPVQHERDGQLVQRDVHQYLVEGAVQEGGVDGGDRVHAAHRQAGRAGHGVLLGDAHVKDTIRERAGELGQARRVQHCRRDGDHVGPFRADRGQLIAEHLSPRAGRSARRGGGLGRRKRREPPPGRRARATPGAGSPQGSPRPAGSRIPCG